MDASNITILKYRIDNQYFFHVLDKFDEPDEVERLARMIRWSKRKARQCEINSQEYEQLWIKTTPIV